MIQTLELQHIRSYPSGLFEFTPGVNIIVGPNASGKTNILEAIHMCTQGRSFRSADGDMISWEASWGRIDATLDEMKRTVKLTRDPPQKTFLIDDVEKRRFTDAMRVAVVVFAPGHMQLLDGEPERRRVYLDNIVAQSVPTFRRTLDAYKKTLAQRNRLLKADHVDPGHLFVWDLRLSELAGAVVEWRAEYVDKINSRATDIYRSVSGGDEELEIFYETKLSLSTYAQSHLQKLKTDYELDRLRGYTGSGPHRDDIGVRLDQHDARTSASRGETRSIVLALKTAELEIIRAGSDAEPLLLLDDVFSELDGKRRRMLAQSLKDTQSFITTTDADAIVKNFLEDYNVITTTSDTQ